MRFGDIIRDLLEEHNMTQRELASKLNLAASTLGSYVQNVREPDFETLKRIAAYFHVSTDYLLDCRSEKADTRAEDELLCVFRSLTPEQREIYLIQGKAMVKLNRKKDAESYQSIS
ncbi:MAG TPA: helix-turn-helix domain-containing protein [Firmicutes bacterium]|nr:helix-turn-helix domain-containing protein [Bacillota bacterium]